MPSNGNNTRGNNAVTASEMPSPTHHMAIKATTANMRCALSVIPSGSGMSKIPQKIISPAKSTIVCFLNVFSIKGGPSKRVQRIDINRGKIKILSRRDVQTHHWERSRLITIYCSPVSEQPNANRKGSGLFWGWRRCGCPFQVVWVCSPMPEPPVVVSAGWECIGFSFAIIRFPVDKNRGSGDRADIQWQRHRHHVRSHPAMHYLTYLKMHPCSSSR